MSGKLDDGIWCDDMQCHVVRLTQDSETKMTYHLAHMNAPDMSGTIRRSLRAFPSVAHIEIKVPGKGAHRYEKVGDRWFSIHSPQSPSEQKGGEGD